MEVEAEVEAEVEGASHKRVCHNGSYHQLYRRMLVLNPVP